MLGKLKESNNKGFTIIEVIIVLAIAGLIILIVLLAIPALQRNGRNTAIKNDASAIAAGMSTYASDNDGKLPQVVGDIVQSASGETVTIGASGTSVAEVKVQGGTDVEPVAATPTTLIVPGTIKVVVKKNCADETSNRAFAIWYSIETSKVPSAVPGNNKCLDS